MPPVKKIHLIICAICLIAYVVLVFFLAIQHAYNKYNLVFFIGLYLLVYPLACFKYYKYKSKIFFNDGYCIRCGKKLLLSNDPKKSDVESFILFLVVGYECSEGHFVKILH